MSGRMLLAVRGGVLHVVPHRTLTLYNGLGKIRWRIEWPWVETLYLTDIAVDSHGRPMILAGHEGRDGFVVFGLDANTGEVIIWMEGPTATFSVPIRTRGRLIGCLAMRYLSDTMSRTQVVRRYEAIMVRHARRIGSRVADGAA